jgi:hypothetical protein
MRDKYIGRFNGVSISKSDSEIAYKKGWTVTKAPAASLV